MLTPQTSSRKIVILAVASILGSITACNRQPYAPPRPSTVTKSAVYLQGPDGKGTWQDCQYVAEQDQCQIWSVSGKPEYGGVFITYEGGLSVPSTDLKISQQGNPHIIKLADGRFLIPADGKVHDSSVRYLDFMTGKTKSFDSEK